MTEFVVRGGAPIGDLLPETTQPADVTRQAETAARFDRWAPTYDDCQLHPMHRAAHQGVLAAAARLGLRPRRILDVGCGTGRLLAMMASAFPAAWLAGIDVSRGMLSAARKGHLSTVRAALVLAAVEHLPFTDCAFDLVITTSSFRHWSDHRVAMIEISRVLAPGAVLLLADAFTARRQRPLARLARPQPQPPRQVQAALAAAQLRLLRVDFVDGFGPIDEITIIAAQRVDLR